MLEGVRRVDMPSYQACNLCLGAAELVALTTFQTRVTPQVARDDG